MLEDLLKVLHKHRLKISPKKCQLFKTELQYMGNTIFIRHNRVCVRPLRSRIEAIQKLEPPMTTKGCRSFVGMVNFMSIFCPKLQKLLKSIYELTRKGRQFLWGEEQQSAFDEIKCRLKGCQFSIYQIKEVDSNYTLIQVNSLQEVNYTKFRMASQNLLHMLVRECLKQL